MQNELRQVSKILVVEPLNFRKEELSRLSNSIPEDRASEKLESTEVDQEIERQELQRLAEFRKEDLSKRSNGIADDRQSVKLLRYETTINREIDRTLNQLERAQRMRLGQPVAPRIELELK